MAEIISPIGLRDSSEAPIHDRTRSTLTYTAQPRMTASAVRPLVGVPPSSRGWTPAIAPPHTTTSAALNSRIGQRLRTDSAATGPATTHSTIASSGSRWTRRKTSTAESKLISTLSLLLVTMRWNRVSTGTMAAASTAIQVSRGSQAMAATTATASTPTPPRAITPASKAREDRDRP